MPDERRPELALLCGNDLRPAFYRGLLDGLRARDVEGAALEHPAVAADWEAWLDHFAARLHGLGMTEGGVLAGHSLGGLTAMLLAAHDPGRFRGLVLLEPMIPPTVRLAARVAARYRRDVVDVDRETFVNWTGAYRRVADPDRFPAWAIEDYLAVRRSANPAVARALMNGLPGRYPLPFDALTLPTLIVRGARAGWRLHILHGWLSRLLPRARLQVVPGAAHWLANEQDDAVAEAVATFVRSL